MSKDNEMQQPSYGKPVEQGQRPDGSSPSYDKEPAADDGAYSLEEEEE